MSQPSWIGRSLGGRYKIEELLGEGGMSSVYKATDPNLRRTVAVKLIHPHLSKDPEFVSRFEEEAAAVARLKHPNVIQVFDFDHDADTYYMVLEYVPGETLQERLKDLAGTGNRLTAKETIEIASRISGALHYAHERGMIHRDVKPANIILDDRGQPILMDFGIAKIIGGKVHTVTGSIVGTALYMSPEQASGKASDVRADIYSLGVVLFEMIGGRPPFEGDSAMTILMKHVNDSVPDINELNPDTPPALKAVIEKALEKDPAARFQSAAEMSTALGEAQAKPEVVPAAILAATILEGEPAQPARTVVEEPLQVEERPGATLLDEPTPAAAAKKRSPLIVVGGVIGGILLLAVAGIALTSPGEDAPATEVPTAVVVAAEPSATLVPVEPIATTLATLVPPVGSSNIYVEYILDGSGSMLDTLDGKSKLAIAKDVLSSRIRTLPPGVNVGLRVYGHNIPFQQEEVSCADIELVVPLQPGGADPIVDWLTGMQAQGMTPMSESIRLASEDFTFEPARRNVIVLISDGIETCSADPAGVVEALQELGIDFKIHVIGLNVDNVARSQLQRLANVAEGTYIDANSEQELSSALGQVNRIIVEPFPPTPVSTPTLFPRANYLPIREGSVQASTSLSGFPASLAVDEDDGTAWFSTGPEPGGVPTTFLWTGAQDDFIAFIEILNNAFLYNASFRTGCGFGTVTVQVLDAGGAVVFEATEDLAGTPDPDVHLTPNVVGRSVRLLFLGHENVDCGGFSDLEIGVYREGAGEGSDIGLDH